MRWLPVLLSLPLVGCLDPERLLREGRAAEVLASVRPVRAADYRRRALALRALGRAKAAADELRIAVTLDPRASDALRELGFVEAQLGALGASLRAFEAAARANPRDRVAGAALARLLITRASQRAQPALGQLEEARADRERAARIDPSLSARPASAVARDGGPSTICPGPGVAATRPRVHTRQARCARDVANRAVEELERVDLLLACRGATLAASLLEQGCGAQAIRIWEGLEREAPRDPRWPLLAGAGWLSLGEVARAQLHFVDAIYYARERGPALLEVARLHLEAGYPRLAGGHAVDALAFPLEAEARAEASRILRAAGHPGEVDAASRPTSAPAPRRPAR